MFIFFLFTLCISTFVPNMLSANNRHQNILLVLFSSGQATPNLSEKPVENEREIPNLNIVNNVNEKAPTFQGSHEGESSQGLPSPDSVTKQPQTSQSVHPSKGEDPEGEHRIQNEADAATSASRGDAGKDDGSQDSEKPMNSENAADHLKANEANIGSGERDHSNTNLKD